MSINPNPPPRASRALVTQLAQTRWELEGLDKRVGPLPSHYLLAVRGYRATSMGPTPDNDVGIYDDATFFVTPTTMVAINSNTDPSRYGWNAGAGKPMASLNPGFWPFHRGTHKGKTPALRQYDTESGRRLNIPNDGRFAVTRTYTKGDTRNYQESGYYAINHHPGGNTGTSSEGCQTYPRDLATKFLQTVWDATKAAGVNTIWYGLLEGPIN